MIFTPPYYVVVFVSQRTEQDIAAYDAMAEKMVAGAQKVDGFLGFDSVRDQTGKGITTSYWRDEQAIQSWKINLEHQEAQKLGQKRWYEYYDLHIAKVERAYSKS